MQRSWWTCEEPLAQPQTWCFASSPYTPENSNIKIWLQPIVVVHGAEHEYCYDLLDVSDRFAAGSLNQGGRSNGE